MGNWFQDLPEDIIILDIQGCKFSEYIQPMVGSA
jgi:hypothetical protein